MRVGSMRDQGAPLLGRPSSPLYGGRGLGIRSKSVTRWLQTLNNLGLLGLWVSILFLGCSRYTTDEDPRGRSLVRVSFRRTSTNQMTSQWQKTMGMASSISFYDNDDQLNFESNRIYSSKSMCIIINSRGVPPAVCYVETKNSSQGTDLSLVFS
jgi:hypothetical protein